MKIASIKVVGQPGEGRSALAHVIQAALSEFDIDATIIGIPADNEFMPCHEWKGVARKMGLDNSSTTIDIIQTPWYPGGSPYKFEIGQEVLEIGIVGKEGGVKAKIVNRYVSDNFNHTARPHVRYGIEYENNRFGDVSQNELVTQEEMDHGED